MKKYIILIIIILLSLTSRFSSAQLNWSGSQWTDNPVFMRSGYVVMSVLEVTGDVSFDGSTVHTLGSTDYLLLDAATTATSVTSGILDINVIDDTTDVSAINIKLEAQDGFSNFYGIYFDVSDDSAGGNETVHGIYLANSAGTAGICRGITMANTLDDDIVSALAAAGQFAVIDASTTDHTETGGVFDISFDTVTNGTSVINIDMGTTTGGSDFDDYSAILIDLDDDATDATVDIIGVKISSSDLTGAANSRVIGFYSSGLDCALQADNGYVRIGTGSTPDTTPGDDDLFVEGTIEVDGIFNADGGADITGDLTTNTIVVSGDATCDGSLYVAGGFDVTSDLTTNSLTVSGATSLNTLTTSGDATCDTSLYVGGGLDVTSDLTTNTITVSGDSTCDGSLYVAGGADITSDLTTNTIVVSSDSTCDGSLYVGGGLDVTSDLTTNSITVSGDVSTDGTVSVNSLLIYQPSTVQVIDGTDDAILANATMIILNPDADYTTDVVPIIADGTIGQIVYITCANGEANRVRVRDQNTLAGSNLQLNDVSHDITGKDILTLLFDGTDWVQPN